MASWNALREHMRVNYKLKDDRDDVISMVWSYDDGRHQKIILRRYQAFDREMVELKSAFASAAELDPRELLRRNAELPLATIAQAGDVYLVVYNTFLAHLNFDDFALYLARVADVADTLEAEFGKGSDRF